MIKLKEGSRIEVWPQNYINFPETRLEEDKNLEIIQIEGCTKEDRYIVEVIEKTLPLNNSSLAERMVNW